MLSAEFFDVAEFQDFFSRSQLSYECYISLTNRQIRYVSLVKWGNVQDEGNNDEGVECSCYMWATNV